SDSGTVGDVCNLSPAVLGLSRRCRLKGNSSVMWTERVERERCLPKLNQTRPDQTRPHQTRLYQTRPDQTVPDQTRPDRTRLYQSRPEQTRPDRTRLFLTSPLLSSCEGKKTFVKTRGAFVYFRVAGPQRGARGRSTRAVRVGIVRHTGTRSSRMGEFTVHRVRFFHYMPSAVRALAFQPQRQKIAVARTDGSLEILNRADHLFQEKVIPGREQRGTEALAWAGQRLFSAGLNGELVEYDMQELREKYRLDASGGPVWTLTCNPQGTRLAVGCEDGTVKLFEVCDDGIQFERNLAKQKGRILSLSWHPSGSRLVAGMAGVIWVFDAGTGQSVHRLLVERGTGAPRSKECVVWSVVCLSDGTIVSGDSSGNVKVWDGDTGTLIRNHQVTKWDVLALSVSQDETSLVAGTSEGTVVQFQHLSVVLGREDKEWVQTRTFKNHTHDVRAVLELDTAVVSGGMDTQLVVRPLLDKIDVKTSASALRKIHFPHRRLVSCSRTARLLLFQHRIHLELWRLGESEGTGVPGSSLPIKRKPEKLLHLKTKVSKLPKVVSSANQICFSSDSSYLFTASTCSSVHVLALSQSGCTFVCTLKPKSCSGQAILLLTASDDGKWLAAANADHEVQVYNLQKRKAYCTVPVYSSGVTAMSINPATNNLFMVHADQQIFEFSLEQKQYTDWSRLVHRKGLHPQWLERDTPVTNVTFSPRNPAHVILHDMYMFCIIDQTLCSVVVRVVYNCLSSHERSSQPLPERNSQLVNQLTLRSLPEKERRAHSHAFKICKTFKHKSWILCPALLGPDGVLVPAVVVKLFSLLQELLFVELLEDQSLVVIERPLLDITAQLPPPVRQKKFAT
ncbi:hypothetical protein P4O66_018186, partial [Electrophorus voltai]